MTSSQLAMLINLAITLIERRNISLAHFEQLQAICRPHLTQWIVTNNARASSAGQTALLQVDF